MVADSVSRLLRRIRWRILPLVLLLYLIAYLDRVNIGFAAASMQHDLGFNDALYGTGAGLFFFGYLIAQVPSNLLLARFGARRTISVIMVVWAGVSGGMAFVHTPVAFLAMRTLLGIAEAGFYPGVIFYLTVWLPRRVRSSATGWFVFGIPLASILGGPLSSAILEHGRIGRFANWQILLLTEAFPALLLGLLLPWLLADSPQTANWLGDQDRELLAMAQAADEPAHVTDSQGSAFGLGAIVHIVRFAAIYFSIQFGLYTLGFWLPKILHNLGVAQRAIGWQISLVWAMAAVGMVVWGRVADTSPRSRWTLGLPLLTAALGYGVTATLRPGSANELWPLLLAFGIAAAGGLAATPTFWSQMTLGQAPARVAVMIAIVNALGNLGGFAGPALLGRLEQHSGTYTGGMLAAAGVLLTGGALLYVRRAEN